MEQLRVQEVKGADFAIEPSLQGQTFHLKLSGNADLHARDPVQKVLLALHDEAVRLHPPEVVVDLRALEFMNSSCFKGFVTWVSRVQELEPTAQYRIRFLANQTMHWQKRSLHALSCFAVDLIQIDS